MSSLKYSKDHEWVRVEGDIAVIGITDYAQSQLGDVVFAEPPQVGRQMLAGDEAGIVESVKAASEIYTPLSGKVIETNVMLANAPEAINTDPTGDGWFFRLHMTNQNELGTLMDEAAYKAYLAELDA